MKTEKSLRLGIEYNQRILETIGVYAGTNMLLLNGILLQEDEFNIYRFGDSGTCGFYA